MSDRTLKRAAEPAHVVAAKNLADVYAEYGGKRAEFLEKHAKRHGFASWNAYRASGHITLEMNLDTGGAHLVPLGLMGVQSKAVVPVAAVLIAAAVKAGYACDHSAPLVISDDLTHFVALSRIGGLALSRRFAHRQFVLIDDIPPRAVADVLTDQVRGYQGLLVLDLPGLSSEDLAAFRTACPDAIILHHALEERAIHAMTVLSTGEIGLLGQRGKVIPVPLYRLSEGMWGDRALSMLTAFAKAKQTYDPKAPPSLGDLDLSHPAMRAFAQTVPAFSVEKHARQEPQFEKANEQFRFLTDQV